MAGVKDITIKLSGDAAGLASAFKVAGREAGKFQGDFASFFILTGEELHIVGFRHAYTL